MNPIETVLQRMNRVRSSGDGYTALCPAHDDHKPSLTINVGADGRVLLHCHKGCNVEEVVAAVGMEMSDLFPTDLAPFPSKNLQWDPFKDGVERVVYTYTDRAGRPIFEVVRFALANRCHPSFPDKTFRQRCHLPDHERANEDGYVWGRSSLGIAPVLFRLPRVCAAVEKDISIFIVEGEKDVCALERVGLTATCNPGGASSAKDPRRKWTPSMTETLRKANAVLLPDNDRTGRAFMDYVAEQLLGVAASVRRVDLPGLDPGGDVSDWFADGNTLSDLQSIVEDSTPLRREPETLDDLLALADETGDPRDVFQHIAILASASIAGYASAKQPLKDATGINLNDLEKAVNAEREKVDAAVKEQEAVDRANALQKAGTKIIPIDNRASAEIVDDAIEAFDVYNDPPELFRRGNTICRPVRTEYGTIRLAEASNALFDDHLSRAAVVVKGKNQTPTDLDERLMQRVKVRAHMPTIVGITELPIVRPDGSLVVEVGYDPETQILYQPVDDITIPSIPKSPSTEDVSAARETLHEAFHDFPWVDEASRANAHAVVLSCILRHFLGDANVPLAILDAASPGTGKTLLGDIISLISTGRRAAAMSAPRGDEELRKQITAQLLAGAQLVLIDNVKGRISGTSLERVLTAPLWSDRVLGRSHQVELPATTIWLASGNNLRPSHDLVRRTFLIRMDAQTQKPWERSESYFRHRQPDWTRKHRGELYAAAVVLVRAWIIAGCPKPDVQPLGSFERWTTVVGGILQYAGIDGFLANMNALYEGALDESSEWAIFLASIYAWNATREGDRKAPFYAKDLASALEETYVRRDERCKREGPEWAVIDSMPDEITTRLRRNEPIAQSLGNAFGYRRDRRFRDGWSISACGADRNGTPWQIRPGDEGESVNPCTDAKAIQTPPPPDTAARGCAGSGAAGQSASRSDGGAAAGGPRETAQKDETPF